MFSCFRRLMVVLLLATWWGGFTFYALAVIPSGHAVLHSQLKQGFITQSVTKKLNGLGVVTLLAAVSEPLFHRRKSAPFYFFLAGWLILFTAQIALLVLHARMDVLLDESTRTVIDESHFHTLHLIYISSATVGWVGAGLMLTLLTSPLKLKS